MDKSCCFTQLGARGEIVEYIAQGYSKFEDLPESERLWLMELFIKELSSAEYDYLINDANDNGELTSYVMAAFKDASKQQELMDKLRTLLEDHLGWQINEMFEMELQNRKNNPQDYWDDAA